MAAVGNTWQPGSLGEFNLLRPHWRALKLCLFHTRSQRHRYACDHLQVLPGRFYLRQPYRLTPLLLTPPNILHTHACTAQTSSRG